MNQPSYINRIAIARSSRPITTSKNAYAQVDQMGKSTNGQFTTKVSEGSSVGQKKLDAIFDLRSANVVRNPNGVITPIDSIPVRMDEESLRILSK